ncbi:hypothetical protein Q5N27_26015, partial [Serratia ureilytica]|uniref:hypothetical protein n=1 Tax=Serratia ureilytica TaxID=300181 RepID=UPI002796B50B
AVGLVLTFKTSGVFNLAFSGQAFFAGWMFYDMVENHGPFGLNIHWPLWAAFLVTVFIVSPLVGLLFDRALFRWMRTAAWQVKLVSAMGLLVALPEIVKVLYSNTPGENPPGIASLLGFGDNAWPDFHGTHSFYVLDLGGGHVIAADLLA